MSINKAMLIGRLGQDPELKYTPNGNAVCNFSVATSEAWSDKEGQKQERTEWHRITVWGKLAELCNQYLSKGRQVFIEGKIQTRQWEKDGIKRYSTEIQALQVQFLGDAANKSDSQGQNRQAPNQGNQAPPADYQGPGSDANFTADEIPF